MGLLKKIKKLQSGATQAIFGTNERMTRAPLLTPEQQLASQQTLKQGLSDTDQSAIENYAMKQFYGKMLPQLSTMFESLGGAGTAGSSGFSTAVGEAGGDLASKLAQFKAQSAMQKLQLGMQPQYENIHIPGQPGLLEKLLPYVLGAAGYPGALMGLFGRQHSPAPSIISRAPMQQQQQQPQQIPQFYPGEYERTPGNKDWLNVVPALSSLLGGQQQSGSFVGGEEPSIYAPGQPKGYDPRNLNLISLLGGFNL